MSEWRGGCGIPKTPSNNYYTIIIDCSWMNNAHTVRLLAPGRNQLGPDRNRAITNNPMKNPGKYDYVKIETDTPRTRKWGKTKLKINY